MALAAADQRKSYRKSARDQDDYERECSYLTPVAAAVNVGVPRSNKWYKDPKIPIHMNMSTMIRMKSKENESADDEEKEKGDAPDMNDNRKMSTFVVPKCNRRMFDYMQQKFEVVRDEKFFGSSYTKNLFWKIVAEHENRRSILASPCGDGGLPKNGTYQRVAAINVNGASGCNLQYIEKISIQSKAKSSESEAYQQIRENPSSCADKFKNLRITKDDQGYGESGSDRETRKKKIKKSRKKPVVVTCLKNTSIKYVRK